MMRKDILRFCLKRWRRTTVLRRPWCIALAAFIPMILALVAQGVLFGVACESGLNFLPEFTDEQVVLADRIELFFLGVAVALVLVSFLAPLVPFVFKRYGHACKMLLYAFGVLIADMVVFAIIGILALCAFGQVDIAMDNIERKNEALRQGKTDYKRRPLPKVRRHTWPYDNGRFKISRYTDGTERYYLVDTKGNPDPHFKNRWLGAVMLDDVVQWKEAHGELYLLTKAGEKLVLDYKKEAVCSYPDSRQYPQCDKADEVFKELEEKRTGCNQTEK